MKQFRSAFVFVLALSLLFGLCACNGSNTVGKTTEAPEVTTEAPKIEDTTEVPTETKDVYRVKVVDETGNPIVGAMVQMCLDASMIDLGSMYCFNWCSYDMLYMNVIRKTSLNFASYAASQDKAIQTRLTEIAEAVVDVQ